MLCEPVGPFGSCGSIPKKYHSRSWAAGLLGRFVVKLSTRLQSHGARVAPTHQTANDRLCGGALFGLSRKTSSMAGRSGLLTFNYSSESEDDGNDLDQNTTAPLASQGQGQGPAQASTESLAIAAKTTAAPAHDVGPFCIFARRFFPSPHLFLS